MTSIVGHHYDFKAVCRRERESRAGRLWNYEDFVSLTLEKHSINIEVLAREKKANKVFRAWKEEWEKRKPKNKMRSLQLGLCAIMVELNGMIQKMRIVFYEPSNENVL